MINTFLNSIYFDYTIRIFASAICGFILGIERKQRQEIIGMKTLLLISISSCLLAIISQRIAAKPDGYGDQGRVAAQVVSGVGFIGGGVILKQGFNVKGITTAAIIFATSALGLSCGIKLYYPAFLILIICLCILTLLQKVEHKLFPSHKFKALSLVFNSRSINENQIKEIISNNGIIIRDTDFEAKIDKEKYAITYAIKCPESIDTVNLINTLSEISHIEKISLTD